MNRDAPDFKGILNDLFKLGLLLLLFSVPRKGYKYSFKCLKYNAYKY